MHEHGAEVWVGVAGFSKGYSQSFSYGAVFGGMGQWDGASDMFDLC